MCIFELYFKWLILKEKLILYDSALFALATFKYLRRFEIIDQSFSLGNCPMPIQSVDMKFML